MKLGFLRAALATSVLASVVIVGTSIVPAQAQLAANAPTVQEATTPPIDAKLLDIKASDRILGNPNAPVTIFEYASLSCTHCATFHTGVLPKIQSEYIDKGKVKLVMRNFPLNEPALKGAMLANCVAPEQYYTFVKVLFQMQDKWAFSDAFKDNLMQIAGVGGVSPEQFGKCMTNTQIEKEALMIRKEGEEGLKIQATPTLFINGARVEGAQSFDAVAKVINAELVKALAVKPAAK